MTDVRFETLQAV